ncbi:MAG TPA: ABC transporter permease [Gemmatimonadaceae bacterium]|nr:ABC transporter permease [Gemmatimonadaceae bacterium]
MSSQSGTQLLRLVAHRSARWSLVVIVLIVIAALVGPSLIGFGCSEQLGIVTLKNAPPSAAHPFGTDALSRDLLARVLCGARISLSVGALAALLATTLGTAYGLFAGYSGGRIDAAMMRLLDAFMSIPRVLLLIAVLTIWHPVPLGGVIVLIGATGWFAVSRLVRAEVMALRGSDFIVAARALGARTPRILWRHVLPNVAAPVIVSASLAVGNVIALEAGLSFLGIGAPPPAASWGAIFTDGVDPFAGAWWVALFPGLAIVVTVLAFNVLGDALRDVLDPRQLHLARPLPESTVAVVSNRHPLENG